MTEQMVRYPYDWEKELQPDEIETRKEGQREIKVVLLRTLQRLAQKAGLHKSDVRFNFIPSIDRNDVGIMQAIYTAEFQDGSKWVGAADCNSQNTKGKFLDYPTAVAESRAEARCLRKALNISILSSEEIGFVDGGGIQHMEAAPGKSIDSQVIQAIEELCETRNISHAELLESLLSKERNNKVFQLSDLTVEEGGRAMSWLNNQKPAPAKKKTAAEERADRKKELLKD